MPPNARAALTACASLLLAASIAACATNSSGTIPRPVGNGIGVQGDAGAIARARADSARHPYTRADIDFMTDMIGHHAQAIVMAGWAPDHGASDQIRTLAARIINAQRDEILTMQTWLRDRHQPVPEVSASGTVTTTHGGGAMAGMAGMSGEHEMHMHMPGMLTDDQMRQLDSARGRDFDRLFLKFMIQHHRGAVSMVQDLFASYGAGQDELIFKVASEVNVDQTTEIARMEKMLFQLALEDYRH